MELADYEKTFLNQADQVNAWDRLLMENGEKVGIRDYNNINNNIIIILLYQPTYDLTLELKTFSKYTVAL